MKRTINLGILLSLGLLAACKDTNNQPAAGGPSKSGGAEAPAHHFVSGATIGEPSELVGWLDRVANGTSPRIVRLPLVLTRVDGQFAMTQARIGGRKDAVRVVANDATLEVGLTDHARSPCKETAWCALWVEAYWRGNKDGAYHIDLVRIGSHIPFGDIGEANAIEIEAPSAPAPETNTPSEP